MMINPQSNFSIIRESAVLLAFSIGYIYLSVYSLIDGYQGYFGVSFQYLSVEDLSLFGKFLNSNLLFLAFIPVGIFFAIPLGIDPKNILIRISVLFVIISIFLRYEVIKNNDKDFFIAYFLFFSIFYYVRIYFEINKSNKVKFILAKINEFIRLKTGWSKKSYSSENGDSNSDVKNFKKLLNTIEILAIASFGISMFEAVGISVAKEQRKFSLCPIEQTVVGAVRSIHIAWENEVAVCRGFKVIEEKNIMTHDYYYFRIPSYPHILSMKEIKFDSPLLESN